MTSQRIWSIRSASSDGGSPSPADRSARSLLTISASVRRSRSPTITGVPTASPFPLDAPRYARQHRAGIGRTTDSGGAAGPPTVGVDRSRSEPKETVMNHIHNVRRVAGVLAGLACAWLGLAMAAPAAFAGAHPTPGPAGFITPGSPGFIPPRPAPLPVQVHTVVVGGMPGWQITLIAIGAALVAAIAAVLADRTWTARRRPAAVAA